MTRSPFNKLPKLTLVLGGARSGKSSLSEQLAKAEGVPCHYIATAEAWDDEMRIRISRHQADRGIDWVTSETPRDVAPVLAAIPAGHVVLLDCATLWLTNHLLADADIATESAVLLAALTSCAAPVIVVSNEVGWGIVPENALGRAFRDHQGRLNQQLAAQADLVIGVMAGLPMVLKGVLPAP
ncbi:MAG: bifunctional adenosylcobinamide kinase/adenosylcobinamide-phosphate guanylyltransferase [Paracoccaceae bacterium]